jgi:hypothetical protein
MEPDHTRALCRLIISWSKYQSFPRHFPLVGTNQLIFPKSYNLKVGTDASHYQTKVKETHSAKLCSFIRKLQASEPLLRDGAKHLSITDAGRTVICIQVCCNVTPYRLVTLLACLHLHGPQDGVQDCSWESFILNYGLSEFWRGKFFENLLLKRENFLLTT